MRKNGPKFIVFEGIDGCGKSTQADLLLKHLKSNKTSCILTREPQQDRDVGKLLRSILTKQTTADPQVTAMLFATDRIDHITHDNGINALLGRGISVICDRYYFSNFAYNSDSVDVSWVQSLNKRAMQICKPDIHIFIDTPVDIALGRMKSRGTTELYETKEKLESVRSSFLELFELYKDTENIAIIDGTGTIDDIAAAVRREVAKIN